ncbi:MAG: hypothetical protein HYU36_00745 [Planctomycetes bacterium]|nr:hypothetical protein [Planctomycetota bacterium]
MKNLSVRRWLAGLLFLNLLLGMAIGILVDQYWLSPAEARPGAEHPRRYGPGGPWKQPSKEQFLKRLDNELHLRDDQEEVLSRLFDEQRDRERQFFQGQKGQFRELRNDFMREMEKVLDEEQRSRFQALMKEMEQKFRKRTMPAPSRSSSETSSDSVQERRPL